MKRKVSKRLINGTASLFSVLLLLSMIAGPVVASVTANSVGSYHIKDNSILNRDIAPNKISSSRIKDYTIVKEDIHSASINKYKLVTGAVNTFKIEDGTIKNVDVAANAQIADSKVAYSTKTKVLTLTGAAFRPDTDNTDYDTDSITGVIWGKGFGQQILFADVQLPDGATVKKVTMRLWDQSITYDARLDLTRSNGEGANANDLASIISTGSTSAFREFTDSTINDPVIDQQSYGYFMWIKLRGEADSLLRLANVRITYEVAGP